MSKAEKVLRYETFLNEVLREDLKKVYDQHNRVSEELAEHYQLRTVIQKLQESESVEHPLKTRVDVGCNFYMQAKVKSTKFIFVQVGYGFYVEFTLQEALDFVEKKSKLLTERLDKLSQDSAHVKARIKIVTEGLSELQNIKGD